MQKTAFSIVNDKKECFIIFKLNQYMKEIVDSKILVI